MDSSANFDSLNINLGHVQLGVFDGLDKSSTIGTSGKIKKRKYYDRDVDVVLHPDRKTKLSDKKRLFQDEFANKRSRTITEAIRSVQLEHIENKLLALANECKQRQIMYKVKHIEDKGFKKLIEKDIRIYFSNEIKKANNPKKLIELYKRIVDIRTQLDPKTYKKINTEFERQCSKVVRLLASHIETVKARNLSPLSALCANSRCVIGWIEAFEIVLPDRSKRHSKVLGKLLSETYTSAAEQVEPHGYDLTETKKTLSMVETLETEVKTCIDKILGKKQTYSKQVSKVTEACVELLSAELDKIPNLAEDYLSAVEKIKSLKTRKQRQDADKEKVLHTQIAEEKNRKDIKDKKMKKFLGKYKIFRLLDMDYQSQVRISKKTTKELSQRVRQVEIALASVKWQLGQAEQKKHQLSEAIQKAVTKYGSSIDHCELKTADEMPVTVQSLSLLMGNTTAAGTMASPVTTIKKRAKRKAPPPPTPIDSTTSPNTNQTIQIEEELPLSSTDSDVEAEPLTTDNSSNILKTSDRQKQPQYDDLVPQQTTPPPPHTEKLAGRNHRAT